MRWINFFLAGTAPTRPVRGPAKAFCRRNGAAAASEISCATSVLAAARAGKNLLRRAPGAWLHCYRRRTGWPKILNRARQLAVPVGPVYKAGRTGELSARSTIWRP
jgi:hypothetical protein